MTSVHVLLATPNHFKVNTVRLTRNVSYSCDPLAVTGIIPPEICDYQNWSEKSDCYCYGIILGEMLSNEKKNKTITEIGTLYETLVRKCIHEEPASRPSFSEILIHLSECEKSLKN